jgi:hypothetical protein
MAKRYGTHWLLLPHSLEPTLQTWRALAPQLGAHCALPVLIVCGHPALVETIERQHIPPLQSLFDAQSSSTPPVHVAIGTQDAPVSATQHAVGAPHPLAHGASPFVVHPPPSADASSGGLASGSGEASSCWPPSPASEDASPLTNVSFEHPRSKAANASNAARVIPSK